MIKNKLGTNGLSCKMLLITGGARIIVGRLRAQNPDVQGVINIVRTHSCWQSTIYDVPKEIRYNWHNTAWRWNHSRNILSRGKTTEKDIFNSAIEKILGRFISCLFVLGQERRESVSKARLLDRLIIFLQKEKCPDGAYHFRPYLAAGHNAHGTLLSGWCLYVRG